MRCGKSNQQKVRSCKLENLFQSGAMIPIRKRNCEEIPRLFDRFVVCAEEEPDKQ